MGWIEFEALWLFCPDRADVFVRCESFEGLESSGEVVGIDEVGEMLSEVFVGLVVEAFDSGFFEGSVHAFDLAVGPGMFRLGEAVVDIGFGAGELEGVSAEEFATFEGELDLRRSGTAIAWSGEVDSIIGQHCVDGVRHGFDQCVQEVGRNPLRGLLMHLDEGELRSAVDSDQKIELALFGANFRDIDMEVANRVAFELLAPGPVAFDVGQPGDIVPLQAAVQRRPGQLRDGGLKSIKAVVKRQQRMPAKGNDNGFLLKGKNC